MNNNICFNERIKTLRKSKNLTQKQVAEKIGVSSRVYAYYEQDRFPKDINVIKKLADVLNTSIQDLIDGTSNYDKGLILYLQDENEQLKEKYKLACNDFCDIQIIACEKVKKIEELQAELEQYKLALELASCKLWVNSCVLDKQCKTIEEITETFLDQAYKQIKEKKNEGI